MKTIRLYGELGKSFGRVHQYQVSTPAEAIRAMMATIKGFKQAMIDGGQYRVSVGRKIDLDLTHTAAPVSDKESISIIPVVAGSGGFGKVLVGAALVSFAVFAPYASTTLFAGTAAATTVGAIAGNLGIALILGGVSELLFKPPKAPEMAERPENMPSFMFNGAVNTTRQGNPVPVCYGRMIVGSQVISAGLSVEQI